MTLRAFTAFQANFPIDREWERPEGASFARTLHRQLKAGVLQVEGFDNWRDCGWCVPCSPFAGLSRAIHAAKACTMLHHCHGRPMQSPNPSKPPCE